MQWCGRLWLTLLVGLCRPAVLTSSSQRLLQRALELHDRGRATEALPLYAAALEAHPAAVAVLAPQAAALEEVGRLEAAQAAAAAIPKADRWQLEVAFALGWQRRGRVEESIAAYRRSASLMSSKSFGSTGNSDGATVTNAAVQHVHTNLGLALRKQGRLDEAITSLRDAVRLSESGTAAAGELHFHLGVSLKRLGRTTEAAAAFRTCLGTIPNHAEAGHLLAALDSTAGSRTDSSLPPQASEGYVRGVFDAAAEGYDEHLEGKLQYRGPELLHRAVTAVLSTEAQARQSRSQELGVALDLGCGTGLSARWMRPLAARLVGVDLSERMIAQADAKQLYDTLIVGDILAELHQMADARDAADRSAALIVAADVFVYLGSLLPVLTAAAKVLQPAGLLAFTVEDCASEVVDEGAAITNISSSSVAGTALQRRGQTRYPCTKLDHQSGLPVPSFCGAPEVDKQQNMRCARDGLVLQSSGRFAHSREHVLGSAGVAGLSLLLEQEVSARNEGGHAVPGRLFVFTQ